MKRVVKARIAIMLIPPPPLFRARSEDPSVYAVKVGGLTFLIKNLYYENIAVNIPNTLDLEAQKISTKTKTSSINKNSGTSKRLIGYLSKTPLLKQPKFQYQELAYALENTDLNKTPGPDGIHGQMISNLGKIGKERLLHIFNNSW
ncbi:hypothetical protein LAZ67_X002888 [Cordylochernes scorpioides]|uniref:Uncharacterized protein n=1 Tax=Cordylochernes scorpioides TaxID=51811 RepID=A0ABY6LTQ0_9ARAC|nr:hypothetical protein LAZ67_X002888 [Cordylochernes scorpioides]